MKYARKSAMTNEGKSEKMWYSVHHVINQLHNKMMAGDVWHSKAYFVSITDNIHLSKQLETYWAVSDFITGVQGKGLDIIQELSKLNDYNEFYDMQQFTKRIIYDAIGWNIVSCKDQHEYLLKGLPEEHHARVNKAHEAELKELYELYNEIHDLIDWSSVERKDGSVWAC
jgi:hypothetical protein